MAARVEWQVPLYEIDEAVDMESVKVYLRGGSNIWAPGNYTKQGLAPSYIFLDKHDTAAFEQAGLKGVMHAAYYTLVSYA